MRLSIEDVSRIRDALELNIENSEEYLCSDYFDYDEENPEDRKKMSLVKRDIRCMNTLYKKFDAEFEKRIAKRKIKMGE